MNRLIFLIVLIGILSTGCLQIAFAQDLVLGHVATRNYQIVITSTSDGVRYSVRTIDGVELDAKLSAAELAKQYPSAYQKIGGAIDEESSTQGLIVWAGL